MIITNIKNSLQKVGIIAFSGLMTLNCLTSAVHAGGGDISEEELTSEEEPDTEGFIRKEEPTKKEKPTREEEPDSEKESTWVSHQELRYEDNDDDEVEVGTPSIYLWYMNDCSEMSSIARKYVAEMRCSDIQDEVLNQMIAAVQYDPTILKRLYATQYLSTVDYKKLSKSLKSSTATLTDISNIMASGFNVYLAGSESTLNAEIFSGIVHRSIVEEGLTRFPDTLKGKILADFDERYKKLVSQGSKVDLVDGFLKISHLLRKKIISFTSHLSCPGTR